MNVPMIGFEDDRMIQRTIGIVNFNGASYEIDWRFHEENGQIVACEPAAWVFLGDRQLTDFVNPDPTKDGWKNIDEVMLDAHRYITSGTLHARISLRK